MREAVELVENVYDDEFTRLLVMIRGPQPPIDCATIDVDMADGEKIKIALSLMWDLNKTLGNTVVSVTLVDPENGNAKVCEIFDDDDDDDDEEGEEESAGPLVTVVEEEEEEEEEEEDGWAADLSDTLDDWLPAWGANTDRLREDEWCGQFQSGRVGSLDDGGGWEMGAVFPSYSRPRRTRVFSHSSGYVGMASMASLPSDAERRAPQFRFIQACYAANSREAKRIYAESAPEINLNQFQGVPLSSACEKGNLELAQWLQSIGMPLSPGHAFVGACENEQLECAQWAMDQGDVDARQHRQAFARACLDGKVVTVKWIYGLGQLTDRVDYRDYLRLARRDSHRELEKWLLTLPELN